MACAWATFVCYGSMMVISFIWGQKEYRVPYAWKKLLAYIVIVVLLYFVHKLFIQLNFNRWINRAAGAVLTASFLVLILNIEKKEFQRLPVIGKFFRAKVA